MTLAEIGRSSGYAESRATEIHTKAVLRLRTYLQDAEVA